MTKGMTAQEYSDRFQALDKQWVFFMKSRNYFACDEVSQEQMKLTDNYAGAANDNRPREE